MYFDVLCWNAMCDLCSFTVLGKSNPSKSVAMPPSKSAQHFTETGCINEDYQRDIPSKYPSTPKHAYGLPKINHQLLDSSYPLLRRSIWFSVFRATGLVSRLDLCSQGQLQAHLWQVVCHAQALEFGPQLGTGCGMTWWLTMYDDPCFLTQRPIKTSHPWQC